jgi:hypothetical protein
MLRRRLMTQTPDELHAEAIQQEVHKYLPELLDKPIAELQADVETVLWSDQPTIYGLRDYLRLEKLRPLVCPHAESLSRIVTAGDAVTSITVLLIPVFPATIPIIVAVKVAVIVFKVGLPRFCRDWEPV